MGGKGGHDHPRFPFSDESIGGMHQVTATAAFEMRASWPDAVDRGFDDLGIRHLITRNRACDHFPGQAQRHENGAGRDTIAVMAKSVDGQFCLGHVRFIAGLKA